MPGFFGPTLEFDTFLANVMTPVMEDAGFKRTKRLYLLTERHSSVVVRADLFSPVPNVCFHLDWSATPAVLRDFLRQDRRSWQPSLSGGLVRTRLTVPLILRYPSPSFRTQWQYNDPDVAVVGGVSRVGLSLPDFAPVFRDYLCATAIPKWKRALTTEYLWTAHEADEDLEFGHDSSRYGGPYWMRAILGADEGDPSAAAAAIDKMADLNPTNPIIPWLRDRLARRIAAQSSN